MNSTQFRALRKAAAAAFLVVALQLASSLSALAASQLADVRVEASGAGNTILSLSFAGGVPAGWHLAGIGTRAITVVLPGTTLAPTVQHLAFAGVNSVQSVNVRSVPNEIQVQIVVASPTVPVFSSTAPNTISIVVGAPVWEQSPAHVSAPKPRAAVAGSRMEVVPLKYADVSEVVGILVPGQTIAPNDTFQPAGSIFSLPTSPGVSQTEPYQSSPVAPAETQSYGERINDNIAIDRRLNAIILSGTPQQIAALKAQIAQIDIPLPSVMLVCEVVELSQTAAHDLGLDLTGGAGTPIGSAGGSLASAGLPQFHADFQANLYATISKGGGRILATPRILALNGTPAQILTGDALPIVSTTIYPGPPTITQQTVNYIAVGVNLQIQPRITNDRFITSHIFAEVSSVTAFVPTQQGNVPQISLRQASTMATVADGQPFVIGGLLQDEEISNLAKIPGVGDLPIIGGLFRVRHDTESHTNLYILITPHIIEPGAPRAVPALPKPVVPGPTPEP